MLLEGGCVTGNGEVLLEGGVLTERVDVRSNVSFPFDMLSFVCFSDLGRRHTEFSCKELKGTQSSHLKIEQPVMIGIRGSEHERSAPVVLYW